MAAHVRHDAAEHRLHLCDHRTTDLPQRLSTDDPRQPFHYYGEPKATCTKAIPTKNDEPLHWFEKEHEIYARWHREGRLTVYS